MARLSICDYFFSDSALRFAEHMKEYPNVPIIAKITIPFAIQESQYRFARNTNNVINNISAKNPIVNPKTHT